MQLAKLSNGLDEGQVGCCQHNKWFKTLENYRIGSPKPLTHSYFMCRFLWSSKSSVPLCFVILCKGTHAPLHVEVQKYCNVSTACNKSSHLREARRKITATMAMMRAATEEQNATITSQVITLVTASWTVWLHVPRMERINHPHVQVTSYLKTHLSWSEIFISNATIIILLKSWRQVKIEHNHFMPLC